MEELQKSATILWNSMTTRTTRVLHSLSGQHVLGMKQLVLREKEQTRYGGGHACNPSTWWGRGAGAGGSPPVQGQPGLLSVRPALTTDSFSAQGTKEGGCEGGSEGGRDRQADRNIPSGWIIRNKYKYACMGVI